MYLTKEEERIYDGEMGWAYEKAIKILVKLGEIFEATRLIQIKSAHISGVSYKTLGDAGTEFLEEIVNAGGIVKTIATINPSSFDLQHVDVMNIPNKYRIKQLYILNLYKGMGVEPILTCTPYYVNKPASNSHLAWAESSAVVYANSILKAWTNREGGPSALAAALIGKTPNYGVHIPENREANVLVNVKLKLQNEMEFGLVGIHVGSLLKKRIPYFKGLACTEEGSLKQLGAALASSGMTSIFHFGESPPHGIEKITLDETCLKRTLERFSATFEKPDLVFIGCPHCSLREIKEIAAMIRGRKIKRDVRFWVCTSRHVKEQAEPYVNIIEKAGGHVLCGTCMVVTWLRELGIETLMTNSAKTAYYAPVFNRVETGLTSLLECIDMAFNP
ncbi:TPA: DUF521 domain-containing protein [Candidatus Bathyarchaeota archaeon]|nr:DUF521 domain-containing protein [Candidatus Bathyarchaeota archaeon]